MRERNVGRREEPYPRKKSLVRLAELGRHAR
jgi:hypothetical protein